MHISLCNSKSGKAADTRSTLQNVAYSYSTYKVGGKAKELEAPELVKEGRWAEALANYSYIMDTFPKNQMAQSALFDIWQIHFNLMKEEKAARADMERYALLYPDDDLVIFMKVAMGDLSNEDVLKLAKEREEKLAESAADSLALPKSFALHRNYPNPFNPGTFIEYSLPEKAQVIMEIYNVLGQKVARLLDAEMPTGEHAIHWNGLNDAGNRVGAGIYLCRMQSGEFVKTMKMTLLP